MYTVIFRQTLVRTPRESICATVAVYLPVLMSAVIAVYPERMGLTRQTLLKQKEMGFLYFACWCCAVDFGAAGTRVCARACAR